MSSFETSWKACLRPPKNLSFLECKLHEAHARYRAMLQGQTVPPLVPLRLDEQATISSIVECQHFRELNSRKQQQ